MPTVVPPQSPFARSPGGGRPSLHLRLWMLGVTTASILATAWLCTLGPLPAILALVVEKHVLVALLIMRLDADKAERPVPEI